MIIIKIKNLERLQNTLGRASGKLVREVNNAMKKSIFLIMREAKARTPVQTGRLRESYRVNFVPLKATLYPAVHYAKYVHEGTKPYIILPVIKKALFWKGAEHPVKKVQHPGIKPRKFLEGAVKASIEKIKTIFNEVFERVLK